MNIVAKDMRKLKIDLTYEKISSMSKNMFKKIVKQKCEKNAVNINIILNQKARK